MYIKLNAEHRKIIRDWKAEVVKIILAMTSGEPVEIHFHDGPYWRAPEHDFVRNRKSESTAVKATKLRDAIELCELGDIYLVVVEDPGRATLSALVAHASEGGVRWFEAFLHGMQGHTEQRAFQLQGITVVPLGY